MSSVDLPPGAERLDVADERAVGVAEGVEPGLVGTGRVRSGTGLTEQPSRLESLLLVYALGGGVAWWAVHLCVSAALAKGVCHGVPAFFLTVNNVVCALGAISAIAASLPAGRPWRGTAALTERARFLGWIALSANVTSLVVILLESIPIYVLDACP